MVADLARGGDEVVVGGLSSVGLLPVVVGGLKIVDHNTPQIYW